MIETLSTAATVTGAYEYRDGVALVRIAHPPVNSLSSDVLEGLHAAVTAARRDERVRAIVLTGDGAMFSGGADIKGFGKARATPPRTISSVVELLQQDGAPVIAAVHGKALGGGLELALGCHYRVAAAETQLGLPEVRLGLIPGAGGTQRLPRLAGLRKAIAMIVSGDPVDAQDALRHGIVDAVEDGNVIDAAIRWAHAVASRPSHPVVDAREVVPDEEALHAARRDAQRRSRGLAAPAAAIDCIALAVELSIQEGLQKEREAFLALMAGEQHAALKYQFFATRVAARLPDGLSNDTVRSLRHIGVVGAGTMGSGIAIACASAGFSVTLVDAAAAGLERGMVAVGRYFTDAVAKGRLDAALATARRERVTPSLDLETLADCDLVIEAVFEQMDIKLDIFGRLDALCKPGAILATNTSRLDVNAIAAHTGRPQDVVGLHFFSPAHVMKLLEVVRGEKTAPDVLVTTLQLARRIGKVPVLVGVCDGFVGNRMIAHYSREAEFMLEEGASVQQIDAALRDFGMAMGRFEMNDLAGLDIGWQARAAKAANRPAGVRYSYVKDRLCELGRFGQKTQAGYYRYEPGSRVPMPDPITDGIVAACASEAGIAQRPIGDTEIVERTIYALVNEGAKILEEGIAQRASDIDVIYTNGYGFPVARGGPMFYADNVGLARVLASIRGFEALYGEIWKPAPLLEQLVAQGRRFQVL